MAIPQTTFTADECMAILDLMDRIAISVLKREPKPLGFYARGDQEQLAALAKLREAGKFYVPD
jgi:hypothetical protein